VAGIIRWGSEGVQGGFNVFSRILIRSKPKPLRGLFSGMLEISYPPPTPNLCRAQGFGEPWGRVRRRLIQSRRFISFPRCERIKHLKLAYLRAGLGQLSLQRGHFFFVFGLDLGNSCIELRK
jgi:hypothetical protein